MDEYLCLTLLSRPGEPEAEFKARLSAAWTHLRRGHKAVFAKVYAETSAFDRHEDGLSRKYLVEAPAVPELQTHLRALAMEFAPVDEDEAYSKFEAAPPEWFWIEH